MFAFSAFSSQTDMTFCVTDNAQKTKVIQKHVVVQESKREETEGDETT